MIVLKSTDVLADFQGTFLIILRMLIIEIFRNCTSGFHACCVILWLHVVANYRLLSTACFIWFCNYISL